MEVFEFARVTGLSGRAAKKTKRLHCFNFGLIFGSTGLHEGYMGRMVAEGRFTSPVPAVGWWLRVGFAPIFLCRLLKFNSSKGCK